VTVEAGVSQGWERWAGDEGAILGLDRFGASAPAGTILRAFGFTVENVASVGRRVVREGLSGRVGVSDPSIGHPHGHGG
jgi:transketolase